jgi:predicted TIM-barrel fold metal-dependent hydrolase
MIPRVTRRAFLTTTALGVASMAARAGAQRTGGRAWIDVHHHILPPAYVEAVGSPPIGAPGGRTAAPQWSVSLSLETMDRAGIATAMTSLSAPALVPQNDGAAERERVRRVVRGLNEFSRTMSVTHPGRFGTFATLCLPDVDGSLAELAFAYEQLRVEGVVLLTNYTERYLGDSSFVPLFDELNRRKAVVFVHPNTCACMAGIDTGVAPSSIEFPQDTVRTVVSLWSSGTLARCPDIRFILPHAGGTIPYIATRVARLNPTLAETLPLVKRQYYDVALSTYPQVLAALMQFAGSSRVVFGTDYPFGAAGTAEATAHELEALGLGDGVIDAIGWRNASRLFPNLQTGATRPG